MAYHDAGGLSESRLSTREACRRRATGGTPAGDIAIRPPPCQAPCRAVRVGAGPLPFCCGLTGTRAGVRLRAQDQKSFNFGEAFVRWTKRRVKGPWYRTWCAHHHPKMFQTIRQAQTLLQSLGASPLVCKTSSFFSALVLSPVELELPIDEASIGDKESRLWKDYSAVGFDRSGALRCSPRNACYD
jgi:hypothetical protein